MTFGSLFSGIGGLDLGLERAGMECRWQVEIDPFCRSVLALHWPQVKRYGDITKLDGSELEPVDFICGGFPCQDLSYAGKQAGIEGSRSGLWFEFARLVGELRPGYVLVENVPGLLVYSGIRRVVGELARLGYVGSWLSLRASDFGGSHLRKRVFIVAHRECEHGRQDIHGRSRECVEDGSGGSLADGEARRRGILREPSRGERFPDGSDSVVDDAAGAPGGSQLETRGTGQRWTGPQRGSGALENAARDEQPGLPGEDWRLWRRGVCEAGEQLADAERARLEIGDGQREQYLRQDAESFATGLPFAPGPSDPRWPAILAERLDLAPALESPVRGMANGPHDWLDRAMKDRTKRLRALGNAVVPQCAEWIGRRILAHAATREP